MKYKKKVANLAAAQRWWDQQSDAHKRSTTRPGSVKCASVAKK